MQPLFPKSQPQIQRGIQKYCQICLIQFSVINREHQCKRCLRAVCSECGKSKCYVWNISGLTKQMHRCCNICKEESQYIGVLIKKNDMQFGKMSKFGIQWSKHVVKSQIQGRKMTVKNNLFTKQTFSQLWKAYNYQLRELVGMLTQKYEQVSIYNMVYNVYTAVISVSPATSLSKVVYLIIFVLCFCSADQAALVVINLIQLLHQHKQIRTIALKYVKAMPFVGELVKIENYATSRFQRFIDSCLINCHNIECDIFIVSQVLKKRSMEDMLMLFASHLYINRQIIFKKIDSSKQMLDQIMLRNCVLGDIIIQFKHLKGKRYIDQQYINLTNTESPIRKNNRTLSGKDSMFKNQLASPTALATLELVKKEKSKISEDSFSDLQTQKTQNLQEPRKVNLGSSPEDEPVSMKKTSKFEMDEQKKSGARHQQRHNDNKPIIISQQIFDKKNSQSPEKQSSKIVSHSVNITDKQNYQHQKQKSNNQLSVKPEDKEKPINQSKQQAERDNIQSLKRVIESLKYQKQEESTRYEMELMRIKDEKEHFEQKLLQQINNNLKVESQFANFRTSYQEEQGSNQSQDQSLKMQLRDKQKELDQEKINAFRVKVQLQRKEQQLSRLKETIRKQGRDLQQSRRNLQIVKQQGKNVLEKKITELNREMQFIKSNRSEAQQQQIMIFIKKNQDLNKELQILKKQKENIHEQYKLMMEQKNQKVEVELQSLKQSSFTAHQEQILTLNIKIKDLSAEIDSLKNKNFIVNEELQQNTRKKQQLFLRIRQMTNELQALRSQNEKEAQSSHKYLQNSKNTEQKLNQASSKVVYLEEQLKISKITADRTKKQNDYQKIALSEAERKITSQQIDIKQLTSKLMQRQMQLSHSSELKDQKSEIAALKNEIRESENRFKEIIGKMNDLTKLMIQIEGEKIQLSQENFRFRALLQKHKVKFEK